MLSSWEHYPNDGKEFLHTMYQLLEDEQARGTLQTITPSAYVAQFPEQPHIDDLWPGSWVSPDYLTWIGEEEENRAWDYLGRVREAVEKKKLALDEETLAEIMDAIYTAEGSDCFWWYGADQNSGDGAYAGTEASLAVGVSGDVLELAIPYADFGKPDAGDTFKLRAVVSEGEQRDRQVVPTAGPGALVVPDLGLTTPILTIADPEKDDHGPGTYDYPSDGVFGDGAYDILEFAVAEDDNNLIFRFTFRGPLNNDWGAPNGMGIHTLDVYIDAAEGGARKLLPGRNAAVPEEGAWEFALWAEGWTPGLYGPPTGDAPEPVPIGDAGTLNIVSDPGQSKITIRVPKKVLAENLGLDVEALTPAMWGYLGVVMSQDGFPASGVWRIRDVEPIAQQWRLGGAPAATNHTRIIDVAYPAGASPTQEEALSTYPASQETDMDALGPDEFAQLPMVMP